MPCVPEMYIFSHISELDVPQVHSLIGGNSDKTISVVKSGE